MDEIVGAKGILTEPSPQENDMTPIRKIGIIGSGQMGNGIAHVIALAGYDVVLTDLTKEKVDKAIELIDRNLTRQVASGKITEEDRKQALSRITYAENYQGLSDADLVIEAATEKLDVKRQILRQADALLRPESILATNTSSISITELAASTGHPERFVGMHFFNPVPVMPLVEVIRGLLTSEDTRERAAQFIGMIGKTAINARNSPGFAVNRILCPMINEAIFALQEGVASAEDIDAGMKLGCNHPIGPLALADLVGLDTLLSVMEVFQRDYGDPKYRPAPLLRELVAAGRLGRKSGQGFFSYP